MADVEVHPIQIGGAGDLSGTIVLFCGHQDAWLSAMKHVLSRLTAFTALCLLCRPAFSLTIARGDLLLLSPSDIQVQTAAGSLKGALNIPFAQYYRGLAASSAYAVLLDTTVEGDAPDLTVLQLGTRPKVRSHRSISAPLQFLWQNRSGPSFYQPTYCSWQSICKQPACV